MCTPGCGSLIKHPAKPSWELLTGLPRDWLEQSHLSDGCYLH